MLTETAWSTEPVSGEVLTQRLALVVDDPSVLAATVTTCCDEQRTAIGIDPVKDAAVVTRAEVRGNPGALFGANAYPHVQDPIWDDSARDARSIAQTTTHGKL